MKNNKLAIGFLGVVIVGIWVFIIQRIFQSSSDGNAALESSFVAPVLNTNTTDTFSISGNYRDPFLGKIETPSENKKSKASPPTPKIIVSLKWPSITYGGMVKNRKSSAQLCMVSINGQSNFMKEGDEINDLQLKKIYKDSIEVVFGKEKKMVRK